MLETNSEEDIVSHLFLTEPFYFNPSQVKRQQLIRLIKKLKENVNAEKIDGGDSQPEGKRKKNFFERKRFVNYDPNAESADNSYSSPDSKKRYEDEPEFKNKQFGSASKNDELRQPIKQKLPPLGSNSPNKKMDIMSGSGAPNQRSGSSSKKSASPDRSPGKKKDKTSSNKKKNQQDDLLDLIDFGEDIPQKSNAPFDPLGGFQNPSPQKDNNSPGIKKTNLSTGDH